MASNRGPEIVVPQAEGVQEAVPQPIPDTDNRFALVIERKGKRLNVYSRVAPSNWQHRHLTVEESAPHIKSLLKIREIVTNKATYRGEDARQISLEDITTILKRQSDTHH